MSEEMTAEEAMGILRAIKEEGLKALHLVPTGDLAGTLTHLSDLVAPTVPVVREAKKDCPQEEKAEAFTKDALPPKEMGQYAIHLTHCQACRATVGSKGLLPFRRSYEILRQALPKIKSG